MPVVPELCTDLGHAGGSTRHPRRRDRRRLGGERGRARLDRDRRPHPAPRRRGAPGIGRRGAGEVLRAGRTTVVIEVALVDEHERNIGIATMSFAVLPGARRTPRVDRVRDSPSTMATAGSRLDRPLLDELGVRVRDAARGVIDVPVIDWSLNSMGAMQGGVVATVAEVAAETALRAATNEPLVVTDLQVTYLGFGRVGPVRTAVDVLGTGAGHGSARRARRCRRREPADDGRARGRDPGPHVNSYERPEAGHHVGRYMGVTMREVEELHLVGHAEVAPHLRGPAGGVRTGALLTMLDNVGGLSGGLAALPDGWVVSTNLAARVVALSHVGPLRIDSGLLRRGRNNVVTSVQIRDEGARRARRERRAHVRDPRPRERAAPVEPSARARARPRRRARSAVDTRLARRPPGRRSRGRDRPRRRAPQSVGHPPRRGRRDARRPRGRARHRRRLDDRRRAPLPRTQSRRSRARERACSAGVQTETCYGSRSATKARRARPRSRS